MEGIRLYSVARAMGDRRDHETRQLASDALKLDPDSVAIARRLGRIYVGGEPGGGPDLALQYIIVRAGG